MLVLTAFLFTEQATRKGYQERVPEACIVDAASDKMQRVQSICFLQDSQRVLYQDASQEGAVGAIWNKDRSCDKHSQG